MASRLPAVTLMGAEGSLPISEWLPPGTIHLKKFTPIFGYLLKIASRCNLACPYCYVYHSPDNSWKTRPKFMSDAVVSMTANRICEHVVRHGLREVAITFHGGEPLLVGPKRLEQYISILKNTIPATVKFGVQTNGTLLSPAFLDLLAGVDASVGISIDGDQTSNDRNRYFHNRRGSHRKVTSGIDLLRSRPEWARMFSGALVVVDLRNDPLSVYEELVRLNVPSVDLLLPDGHHDAPPHRSESAPVPEYGAWLSRVFDKWYADSQTEHFSIKLFMDIMTMLLGGSSTTESIGNPPVDFIIVETDGEIEALDTLKIVGRSATKLGLHVATNSFDEAGELPAIFARNIGVEALCGTCRQCELLSACGGGYLPHRYGRGNGFLNPSVYCDDLTYLITRIRNRISIDLNAQSLRDLIPA